MDEFNRAYQFGSLEISQDTAMRARSKRVYHQTVVTLRNDN
jgi:hypothetical protein